MRKLLILAAALLVVSSAFAASPALNAGRLFVQPNDTFLSGGPATTNNDDSCDISVMPAATLLLPNFEVDYKSPSSSAVNTIFTLTNVSDQPQIAHITIWTDWSFPVIDFNIYLTGYDVQGISLYDIISRGTIPVTGYSVSPVGELSQSLDKNDEPTTNPHFDIDAVTGTGSTSCATLPGPIPDPLVKAVQAALTTGKYPNCVGLVGGTHTNAVGYVTIDVVNKCTQKLPTDASYYSNDILWDNVLIGDYQRINPTSTTGNYAGGNPLVHIRAIPEAPTDASGANTSDQRATETNFDYTFYDRYTPSDNREMDRRQPLPGIFAARFIDSADFSTNFAIWREGYLRDTGTSPSCGKDRFVANEEIEISGITRFDESENPTLSEGCQISPCTDTPLPTFPESSSTSVADETYYPADNTTTDDPGGWMWLNLNNGGSSAYSDGRDTSQNWVIIQMTAEGRYGVDFDAAALGNGCSGNTDAIGPLDNFTFSNDNAL